MEPTDCASPEILVEPTPAPQRSALREVLWKWTDVFVGFAPVALVSAANSLLDPTLFAGAPSWVWIPATALAQAWLLCYPLWIARRRGYRVANPLRLRTLFIESLVALFALLVLSVMWFVTAKLLAYGIGRSVRRPLAEEQIARSPYRYEMASFAVLAVLVAPVAEEIFFRGFLYNALRRRLNRAIALVLQATAFGLIHPFGLVNAVPIAVSGLVLAAVYDWRKNLLAPVFLHALQNLVGVALLAGVAAAYASSPVLGINGNAHDGGCRLTAVVPESAAEIAGLRVGDVITVVDGESVEDIPSIARIMRSKQAGDRISVEFLRDGTSHRVEPVLKKRRE